MAECHDFCYSSTTLIMRVTTGSGIAVATPTVVAITLNRLWSRSEFTTHRTETKTHGLVALSWLRGRQEGTMIDPPHLFLRAQFERPGAEGKAPTLDVSLWMSSYIERLNLAFLLGFRGQIGQPRLKRSDIPGNPRRP